MGNSGQPYEVKLLNRLLDFDENLCELLFSRNMTLFFYKIFWKRYLVDFLLHKCHCFKSDSGARPPAKREREGHPPRCRTSQKKGHHSVNFGPILTILGSKWPQRIDLSFKIVFLMWKWLEITLILDWKDLFWSAFLFRLHLIIFRGLFEQFIAIFALNNTVPYDRSNLCGHLEPKMAQIGPKLTEWWPFF